MLKAFVDRGGGLITLHTAASTNKASAVLADLVGARQVGGVVEKHTAYIVDPAHPITAGLANFELDDEIHQLEPAAAYHVLVDGSLIGIRQPLVFVKQTGAGMTVHFATGHKIAGITEPTWQELFPPRGGVCDAVTGSARCCCVRSGGAANAASRRFVIALNAAV